MKVLYNNQHALLTKLYPGSCHLHGDSMRADETETCNIITRHIYTAVYSTDKDH